MKRRQYNLKRILASIRLSQRRKPDWLELCATQLTPHSLGCCCWCCCCR